MGYANLEVKKSTRQENPSRSIILDETLPSEVTLFDLASGTPLLWDEQRAQIQSVCRVVSLAEPDD